MPEIFRHQRATLLTTPTNVNWKKKIIIFLFFGNFRRQWKDTKLLESSR
jgi:hypothetical protein